MGLPYLTEITTLSRPPQESPQARNFNSSCSLPHILRPEVRDGGVTVLAPPETSPLDLPTDILTCLSALTILPVRTAVRLNQDHTGDLILPLPFFKKCLGFKYSHIVRSI